MGAGTHPAATLILAMHVVAGAAGLTAGTVSALARKGGRLHRGAGNLFFVAMGVMAVSAIYLGAVTPKAQVNVVIGLFTLYLVVTGWRAVRAPVGKTGAFDWGALAAAALLAAPFVILSAQLAIGLPTLIALPFRGPLVIAIYAFTTILVIAAMGDALVVFRRGVAGPARTARHLWRMLVGLTLAYGSGFTNGIARLVPKAWGVPEDLFLLPQFLPLLLLAFWMVRVRLAGWRMRPRAPLAA